MTKVTKTATTTAGFLDLTSFKFKEFSELAKMSGEDRAKAIKAKTQTTWTSNEFLSVTKMTFYEELVASLLFLFGVPGAVFSFPVVIGLLGIFMGNMWHAAIIGALILIPLALAPTPFSRKTLSSWYALQILRYFSLKFVYEEPILENKPYILVAPPHGVFPFGNIITMIAFPSLMGFEFKGLAASAALRLPIFRQLLCSIGVIDASRKSATKALNANRTIGISTGGVAEVFETNSATGDEVIVLKSRKGLIKLAFRTGASLVPCYLFGNTKLFSLFTGGSLHSFFKRLSRKLGFATIIFWGRFGVPVPYRIPIVGAMAKPIPVPLKENPTPEEIDAVHEELMQAMVKLFDTHKEAYGWGDKKLIIE
eukprot:gene19864-22578_t